MTEPTITLVDRPDRPDPNDEFALYHVEGRESQRTYKVSDGATTHTVRISRDDTIYQYRIENLVGGKWHKLLTGQTTNNLIPWDEAAARAAAVLL